MHTEATIAHVEAVTTHTEAAVSRIEAELVHTSTAIAYAEAVSDRMKDESACREVENYHAGAVEDSLVDATALVELVTVHKQTAKMCLGHAISHAKDATTQREHT